MIEWSIDAFRAAAPVGSIVIACPAGQLERLQGSDLTAVEGGETRSASVGNALRAVDSELVAIHDAARPLVDAALIEAVVETLLANPEADAAIAATPVTDTIKQASPAGGAPEESPDRVSMHRPQLSAVDASIEVSGTVDRGLLWGAQTPQVFRTEALRRALESDPGSIAAATDEAMLVEAAGGRVLIYPASPQNLKVTTPLDMRVAELLLAESASACP